MGSPCAAARSRAKARASAARSAAARTRSRSRASTRRTTRGRASPAGRCAYGTATTADLGVAPLVATGIREADHHLVARADGQPAQIAGQKPAARIQLHARHGDDRRRIRRLRLLGVDGRASSFMRAPPARLSGISNRSRANVGLAFTCSAMATSTTRGQRAGPTPRQAEGCQRFAGSRRGSAWPARGRRPRQPSRPGKDRLPADMRRQGGRPCTPCR